MKHEIKKLLYDIKISILSIEEYLCDNKNFFEFQNNKLLRRAIERELEIIGEALNKILKIEPNLTITNARKIVATRNWIIHSYDNVDEIVIWSIVTNHLPLLKSEIEYLLIQ
jgi:uncharacterized protein with HEPN domain